MNISSASRRCRTARLIPALGLAFTIAFATAGLATETKPTDRVPEWIGYNAIFDHTTDIVKAILKGRAPEVKNDADKAKASTALGAAVDAAFAPETLRREFLLNIGSKLDDADLDQIFSFYKSPLGMKVTALENVDSAQQLLEIDPDKHAAAEKKRKAAIRKQLVNDVARVEVLRLIERSAQISEIEIDTGVNAGRAVAIGMTAASGDAAALSAGVIQNIDAAMEKERTADVTAQTRIKSVIRLAYTYREVSTQDLRQYLAFLDSPAGKKLRETARSALTQALLKAGTEYGHAVMKELGKTGT